MSTDEVRLLQKSIIEGPLYTVSELNSQTRLLLEEHFQHIWLVGEISNLARPTSGHLYFSLKDQYAQIRCAFFKGTAKERGFIPENGQQVYARARVSLYEVRGDYQLIISKLEPAGSGQLQLAFEKLKTKLHAEGLFDAAYKKSIPPFVRTVGVITSTSGAAIRDVLHVLNRRCKSMRVIIYPTGVQGAQASLPLVAAIQTANRRNECDVLLLVRGGGSLEDLWAFNEESVARTLFASTIPIVTGIGHEIDFTIADFVADLRAPTPSAAAELISPDLQTWTMQLHQLFRLLERNQIHILANATHNLQALTKRLRHPSQLFKEVEQRLNHYKQQLILILLHHLQHKKSQLNTSVLRLLRKNPHHRLAQYQSEFKALAKRLALSSAHQCQEKRNQLSHLGQQLENISPLHTLQRGYAIVTRLHDQTLVHNASQVTLHEKIKIKLRTGHLIGKIEHKSSD